MTEMANSSLKGMSADNNTDDMSAFLLKSK